MLNTLKDRAKYNLVMMWEQFCYYSAPDDFIPINSIWYLSNPSFILTADPQYKDLTLKDLYEEFGLTSFIEDSGLGQAFAYPTIDNKKANGHDVNFICSNLHASGRLATFSFVGSQYEIHVIAKTKGCTKSWQLDHITIEEGDIKTSIDCENHAIFPDHPKQVMEAFYQGTKAILEDPLCKEQDADVIVGKFLKPVLDDLDTKDDIFTQKSPRHPAEQAVRL